MKLFEWIVARNYLLARLRYKWGKGNKRDKENRPGRLTAIKILALSVAVGCFAIPAAAHFLLNVNIRIFHVLHEEDRIRVLARVPMPYLVADKLGPVGAENLPEPAPFTTNEIENGNPVHYLDAEALRKNPKALGKMLADGIVLTAGEPLPEPLISRVRAYPASRQPPFATKREAESALDGPTYDSTFPALYVGDSIIDVELIYQTSEPVSGYRIYSTLDPGLSEQDRTANLIIDHASDPPLIYRISGPMNEPVNIGRSIFSATRTFALEGMFHVFEGWDHLLFIFCLVLGASSLGGLVLLVTGFTLGHTITLSLGFLGFAPNAPWFIPLVETGIAASILYAAFIVIFQPKKRPDFIITSIIGLLHGLGFSFVLREILQIGDSLFWLSLLSFNIGIEIGQILFAAAIWIVLTILSRRFSGHMTPIRTVLAGFCIPIAAIWIGERSVQFYAQWTDSGKALHGRLSNGSRSTKGVRSCFLPGLQIQSSYWSRVLNHDSPDKIPAQRLMGKLF